MEQVTWKDALSSERKQPYFQDILKFVESERRAGKKIFPKNDEIFNALSLTPFKAVKVVILGQDPYHGPGQAHGLCFSVKPGVPFPPSLQNIYKELISDVGIKPPTTGCLEAWAKEGVLLLNAVLTVEAFNAASHANRGWERFTDRVIHELNEKRSNIVFLLWGSYAQKKASFVDHNKHLVLQAPHPSPLSAHRGFLGCHHFSKANAYLIEHGIKPVNWQLP
jgi:uracil-DNA glycosylase